ncbi:MAG: hypothetical protein CMO80_07695 [Verrucomicrobiales bacterium]|nr:hypothetical protein [Verrucomicrobiales bacterium]|tara:strand:+ start:10228 stop:12327 length:2100 start_codon:yes stop_codon:yes gene_type:complete
MDFPESHDLGQQTQVEKEFSLRDSVDVVLDHAWLIILIFAACFGGAYYYLKTATVIYESRATIIVEFAGPTVSYDQNSRNDFRLMRFDILNTMAQTVGRREVIDRAAELIVDREQLSPDISQNDLRGQLGGVSSSLRKMTRFIDVSFRHRDRVFAMNANQAIVEAFVNWDIERKMGRGTNTIAIHTTAAEELKVKWLEAQEIAHQYVKSNSLAVGMTDMKRMELESIGKELTVSKNEKLKLDTDWKMIQQYSNNVERLLTVQSILDDKQVSALRTQELEKRSEISQLEERYREKHPKMIAARKEVVDLGARLQEAILAAPSKVHTTILTLSSQIDSQQGRLEAQEKKVAADQQKEIEYKHLKAQAESLQAMYQRVLGAKQESSVTEGIQNRTVEVYNPASLPGAPVSPRKSVIMMVAMIVGCGLSFMLVFIVQQLDKTVKSIDEAERLFGVPVVGAVPKNPEIKDDQGRLFVTKAPNSSCAEAFRTLRASISLLGREEERRVILFTSAVPSEGKTFCSVNYAIANASQGKKTLIMDFDLRRPSVGDTFHIDRKTPGVTDLLLANKTLDEVALKTDFENLTLIPAGSTVPNPSELIASDHVKKLIDDVVGKYDQVVIDNAPVTAVSDTLLILEYVQTICMVTRAAKTSYRLIGRALELVRRSGKNVSGLVLNFVPEKRRAGYNYYYYTDKKYYGYGEDKR